MSKNAFRHIIINAERVSSKTAEGKTAALLDIEVAPGLSLPRNRASIRQIADKVGQAFLAGEERHSAHPLG